MLVPLFLFSCSGNQSLASHLRSDHSENGEMSSPKNSLDHQERAIPIAPEYCRVIAKVISTGKSSRPAAENSPCQNYPCEAEIMIQKVIGYGSSFSSVLSEEQVVKVYFPFTLNSTKEVFPDKETIDLPGLKVGDKFEADMEGGLPGSENYTIYKYLIKE